MAYSGQCLTSEALGGRSANRGECAQACRMPYELVSDGQTVALGDRRYLLSPQDLAGLEVLPALVRAGVSSLKIEGRLKSPEYVANITRTYREALDNASAPRDQTQYNLEMAFSRGLYTGWFGGINNQRLVHARFGKKRGVYLGEVRGASAARSVFASPASTVAQARGMVLFSTLGIRTKRRKADESQLCQADRSLKSAFLGKWISIAFMRATKSGKPAIPNWIGNFAKAMQARCHIFTVRSISKSTATRVRP